MTKYTTVAIAYDFDGTLAKGNIQENSYIPDLGMAKEKFWKEVKTLAKKHEMDENLAYMYLLIKKGIENEVEFTRKALRDHGKNVKYFKGVEKFFPAINAYAKRKGINLEHYIISSGTKEMIEGTSIAKEFKYIYASSFKFDSNNVPEWPAFALNYTQKTQMLFRINKGIENVWDSSRINEFTLREQRRVPFANMIYIGDGLTDVPAMRLVKKEGGHSIAVYTPNRSKQTALDLLTQDRANYVARADYSKSSELVKIIKGIIDEISARESIAKYGIKQTRTKKPTRKKQQAKK